MLDGVVTLCLTFWGMSQLSSKMIFDILTSNVWEFQFSTSLSMLVIVLPSISWFPWVGGGVVGGGFLKWVIP